MALLRGLLRIGSVRVGRCSRPVPSTASPLAWQSMAARRGSLGTVRLFSSTAANPGAASKEDGEGTGSGSGDFRAHDRLKTSDDPTVVLAGQAFAKAEMDAWNEYEAKMSWKQWLVSKRIFWNLRVRHSFTHGGIRQALTFMAVYAAGAELLHDFFHDPSAPFHEYVHLALTTVGTNHAVGFIALSHLSEHYKEHLEEQDKPAHHREERERLDLLRIFAGKANPTWPRHIRWYNGRWAQARGDLGCFVDAAAQKELIKAEGGKKGGGTKGLMRAGRK